MNNSKYLVPAKKGEVRNKNGRPKGRPNEKTRLRKLLELTQKTVNPLTGESGEFSILEIMDAKLINLVLSDDTPPQFKIAAYKEILDRYEGKSIERKAETDNEGTDRSICILVVK